MAYLHESITFDAPAALSAAPADILKDKAFYAVSDVGDGSPAWFQYQASSVEALEAGVVLAVDNGPGRLRLFGGASSGGGGLTLGATNPNSSVTAAAIGEQYLQVASGTEVDFSWSKRIIWVASQATNTDWLPVSSFFVATTTGTANPGGHVALLPDYQGQQLTFINLPGSYSGEAVSCWIATAAGGTWLLV